jgi:hypothetical protein
MPSMRIGRLIAAAYLLAVLVAVVVWLVSGAESAFLVTTALTLPLSGFAYGILGVGAMALAGVPAGLSLDPPRRHFTLPIRLGDLGCR